MISQEYLSKILFNHSVTGIKYFRAMYKQIGSIGSWLFFPITLALINTSGFPSQAVQAPDGTVSFESAVLLVDAYTTFSGIRVRQARYYFDLQLPENIGEPLKKVVIQQRRGSKEIKFKLEETKAYLGDHRNKEEPLESFTSVNEETGEVIVEFKNPIPPGNNLTVGIKPRKNPDVGGVYLFGVTAFPEGEKSRGLYLGAGRLHFTESFHWSH